MTDKPALQIKPLGFPWATQDPFLFCAFHLDNFPKGNADLGPAVSLEGRNIGQDFAGKDGWNMYHGSKVPGFPSHPHRGFETITIVAKGIVDHSDSMGASGRFGNGDVQWMTAGKGVQHSEMFPLLKKEEPNPFLLFQIWLNLPAKSKFVEPHFSMLWKESIKVVNKKDESGRNTEVTLVVGNYAGSEMVCPAPDSWAADQQNQVAIWTIKMDAFAQFELPAILEGTNRSLYYYQGDSIEIGQNPINVNHSIDIMTPDAVSIFNGSTESHFLLLQGRPINEPVVQYGPFVMNSENEIRETIHEYQQTQFGGWPWPVSDHVHPEESGRFALHADGREEKK